MPASPKPPRTPPKSKRPIRRKTPLKAGAAPVRRTAVRRMSDRKRAEVAERRDVTRPGVLRRDGYRCRACGASGFCRPRVTAMWLEVHEEPPRSRGGDPTDPADCITMCATLDGDGCHQRRTAGKLRITKGPDGCNAPVTFTEGTRSWQG